MLRKALLYLGIESFGWYEMFFAMYMILAGYQYGSIPISALALIILSGIALMKGYRPIYSPRIILYVFIYIIFKDFFVWMILSSHPSYIINNIIVNITTVFSIYIIATALDYKKFISMLYLVTFVSLIGLLYHVFLIRAGMMVEPIRLPFMPEMSSSSRAFEEGFRPKSFFWEPAACVTFLMLPFIISILQKRWLWVIALMLAMFLSTSTNGIVLSTIILVVYIFTQKIKIRYKVLVIMLVAIMVYLFFNTDLFEFGREKMLNTEANGNARISNGPLLVLRSNPIDLIFGVFSGNAFDYIKEYNISTQGMQIDEHSMFVPTFWNLLLNYGAVGLILYLSVYLKMYKEDKRLTPYLISLLGSMFVQSIFIGSNYVFQIVCMLLIIRNKDNNESFNINIAKC